MVPHRQDALMGAGKALRLCLAGAPIDSPNRGVAALGQSVIDAVDSSGTGARVSVFDDGWGVRAAADHKSTGELEFVGVRVSRRWNRPESWTRIRAAQMLRRYGNGNAAARRIAEADAVLDISGGDSFTDLYGALRFRMVTAPKLATLRVRRPLVLLPQTYGPFTDARARRIASSIIRSAHLCYARDQQSYERLIDLAGDGADLSSLREGVDVAFALDSVRPAGALADEIETLGNAYVMAGVNVSGLLMTPGAHERFGLTGDYMDTMTKVVKLLISAGSHVLFISHVHGSGPSRRPESDADAIAAIRSELSPGERKRTSTTPLDWNVAELKWAIARCAWFTGSRMHSTIGALSSGVPTFGYAYSDKTEGVFDTCGMGEHVQDARKLSGDDAAEAMFDSFRRREETRPELARRIPGVVEFARQQILDVLTDVEAWRDDEANGGVA